MFKQTITLLTSATLISCITVNIYFPAAAAEKAADQIIREVWHKNQPASSSSNPNSSVPQAQQRKSSKENTGQYHMTNPRAVAVALFSAMSRDAYAQGTDFFKVTSPQIEQIKARISRRFYAVRPFFQSGAIGLTANGYVAIHDASAVPMAQRAKMNQLVKADNADRKALYKAIAAANNRPDWFEDIQNTFASRWIVQLEPGWWYQKNGQWVKK